MGLEQTIELAIKKISKKMQFSEIVTGITKNVTDTTCEVHREGSPVIFDVRLNAIDDSLESYVTIYPAADSNVIVGIIEGQKTEAVVLRCSEVERIKIKIGEMSLLFDAQGAVFNEGTNNGLIIIQKLISDLSKYSSVLTSLKAALDVFVPAGTVADGAALASALKLAMSTYQSPTFSEIENPKIKH